MKLLTPVVYALLASIAAVLESSNARAEHEKGFHPRLPMRAAAECMFGKRDVPDERRPLLSQVGKQLHPALDLTGTEFWKHDPAFTRSYSTFREGYESWDTEMPLARIRETGTSVYTVGYTGTGHVEAKTRILDYESGSGRTYIGHFRLQHERLAYNAPLIGSPEFHFFYQRLSWNQVVGPQKKKGLWEYLRDRKAWVKSGEVASYYAEYAFPSSRPLPKVVGEIKTFVNPRIANDPHHQPANELPLQKLLTHLRVEPAGPQGLVHLVSYFDVEQRPTPIVVDYDQYVQCLNDAIASAPDLSLEWSR